MTGPARIRVWGDAARTAASDEVIVSSVAVLTHGTPARPAAGGRVQEICGWAAAALSYSRRSCPVCAMLSDFPRWTHTLDSMIETVSDGFQVKASCTVCGGWRRLDRAALEALRDKVGGQFSLVNKRCACRLRRDCPGKNRFHYQSAVMRPLWDDETLAFWMGVRSLPGGKRRR